MPFWKKSGKSDVHKASTPLRPFQGPPTQPQYQPPAQPPPTQSQYRPPAQPPYNQQNQHVYQQPVQQASQQPARPSAPNPFSARGDELFNAGDYTNALFMYNEAIRVDGNDAFLYLQTAFLRTLVNPPQLDQALLDVDVAIQINPGLGAAWKRKGDIYMLKGDYQAAEGMLVQATSMLQGYEKLQAQQELAKARSQGAAQPPPTVPLANITTQLPLRPQSSAPPPNIVNRPLSSSVSPASPAVPPPPAILTPPQTQSTLTSTTHSRTPSLASPSITPGGLAPPSSPPTARSPSPNSLAQGEMLAQQLDIPTEAPPSYTTSSSIPASLRNNAGANMTQTELSNLRAVLDNKRKGSLQIRPFTAEGQIDSIQLLFQGYTYIQSILMDIPPRAQTHVALKNYTVETTTFPGTIFIDLDCETTASHEGYHTGTTTVFGYAEEYREYQLTLKPMLNLHFEASAQPPIMTLTSIVERIQLLQGDANLEDNTGLAQILGLVPSSYIVNSTRKTQIEDICMKYHRGLYDAPSRFIDLLTTGTFSRHFFGVGEGIGLTNFLFHILLGAELYIRLTKAGTGIRYPNIMTGKTSALVVLARQWMENVSIRVSPPAAGSPIGTPNKHTLIALNNVSQAEGLLRFAETIGWPFLDEARQSIESAYDNLISNPANVSHHLKDWLYGLCLPGKYFRHRIMSCLIFATPSIKSIGAAPFYDNGLVVGNKSYWPRRSVLGRVLGSLINAKSTCGWIGPVPAPIGFQTGWILLSARRVNFTMPAVNDPNETSIEILGFSEAEVALDPDTFMRDVSNLDKWVGPLDLPARPVTDAAPVRLKALRLEEVTVPGLEADASKQHRALLDFNVNDQTITYTLYTNPVFVHVPKCAGSNHPIHERLTQKYLANVVYAKDLKGSEKPIPAADTLMIIDASQQGEPALARAWCAEAGKHAIVMKAGVGCFACATALAAKRTGLGFNVLIWSR